MTVAKSVFRRCLGNRLELADMVRKDRQSVSDHIARSFFEGGESLTFSATVKLTPSPVYVSGINAFLVFEPTTIKVIPDDLWMSADPKAMIRVSGQLFITGINQSLVFEPATVRIIPELMPVPNRLSLWAEIKVDGGLSFGPVPPLQQYHGSVFRRCPGDRLNSSMLIRQFRYNDANYRPIANDFFEGHLLVFDAKVRLAGEMSISGINSQLTMEAAVRLAGSLSFGNVLLLEGTVYNIPVPFTMTESVIASALNLDVTVSRSMIDPVSTAIFNFDGDETGGIYSSIYYRDIILTMPDENSVDWPVFVGFFPSSRSSYGTVDKNESLSAFDFGWYLGTQYLKISDLSLLTPTGQAGSITRRYMLNYVSVEHQFIVGQVVTGGTSGHVGRIIEVHSYGTRYIVMNMVTTGTDPFFQNGETLLVNEDIYAYADGHTMDVTGTVTVRTPNDWILSVLGGDNWANVTGIEPYRIADTSDAWGGTKPAVDFIFDAMCSKITAIKDMAQALGFVMEIKPRAVGSSYRLSLYFIPQENIDNSYDGLDLPDVVTMTNPSPYLDEPVVLTQDGGKKYNSITVWCETFAGAWLSKTLTSSGVDAGTEKPIEFAEIAQNIATQAECTQRCQDLWDYNHLQILKWQATIIQRPDLQKYQKLIFSGYGTQIPDDTYRIIDIQYVIADGGTTNKTVCTLLQDSQFSAYLNLNRVFTDSITMVEALIKNAALKLGKTETGTVSTDTDGKLVVTTDRGTSRVARSP
jgi:hypothetical protein